MCAIIVGMTEQSTSDPPSNARRGIQSVEIGLRVLTALAAAAGPSTLSAIGVRCGLSPPQTHRYLQSLLAAGMAVQGSDARYDLGPGVIRIGIAALARLDSFRRIETALQRFVEDTGRTVALSVWGEAGPVCVRWLPGRPPVMANVSVGTSPPLLYSATGRVFMALLSEQELSGPLAVARASSADPPDLAASLQTVHRSLTCTMKPPIFGGVRATAAPVFDMQGRVHVVAAALAATMFPESSDDAAAHRLLAACREATEALGGVWPRGG